MKIELDWSLRTVALAFILVILGSAALYWLVFAEGYHSFQRTLTQENRNAEAVGASPLPTSPIKVEIQNEHSHCSLIDRARIEGTTLTVYWHNNCPQQFDMLCLVIKGVAPDGTIVYGDRPFVIFDQPIASQERRESTVEVKDDSRIVTLQIWLDK